MTAVDTNVVVRLLTQDDRQQAAIANSVFATGRVWIAKTVLLETNWVLHHSYRFQPQSVLDAFGMLLGLPNLEVEDREAVAAAISLARAGIEFADALHLASRSAGTQFVSFDQGFVRKAQRAGATGVGGLNR